MACLAIVGLAALPACTSAPAQPVEGARTADTAAPRPAPFPRDLQPYAGLGAWVDAFDYAPAYQDGGGAPPLGPDDVDDMARRGVKTLFLQATRWDSKSPEGIVDHDRVADLLRRAHDRGMRVVGWYLPRLVDLDVDLARSKQILDFDAGGDRFDGLAIDIEYTEGEPDPAARNTNLIAYSQKLHDQAGGVPIAAVVLSAVHLEVVNDKFWPDFPYAALRPFYAAWMPMAYWTLRTGEYRDPYKYVTESITRLRANLGEPAVVVAAAGGIADESTDADLAAFAKAVKDSGSIGGSIYDWATMAPEKQALLQRLFASGPASSLPAVSTTTPS